MWGAMKQHFSLACGGQDVRISAAQAASLPDWAPGIGCLDLLFACGGKSSTMKELITWRSPWLGSGLRHPRNWARRVGCRRFT